MALFLLQQLDTLVCKRFNDFVLHYFCIQADCLVETLKCNYQIVARDQTQKNHINYDFYSGVIPGSAHFEKFSLIQDVHCRLVQ